MRDDKSRDKRYDQNMSNIDHFLSFLTKKFKLTISIAAIFDGISPFSREFEHFMAKYHHF